MYRSIFPKAKKCKNLPISPRVYLKDITFQDANVACSFADFPRKFLVALLISTSSGIKRHQNIGFSDILSAPYFYDKAPD